MQQRSAAVPCPTAATPLAGSGMSRQNNPINLLPNCRNIVPIAQNCMVVPLVLDVVHPVLHNVPLLIMLHPASKRTPRGSCECINSPWQTAWLVVPMSPCPPSTRFVAVSDSSQSTAGAHRVTATTADNATVRGLPATSMCNVAHVTTFHRCHCHCFGLVTDGCRVA